MKPSGRARAEGGSPLAKFQGARDRILEVQLASGAIPWFEDGPWDPWNHTECAMALSAMGDHAAAASAYEFLRREQRPDGAWMGEYGSALPMADRLHMARSKAPAFLDSNFIAYPAVGAYHRYMTSGDRALAAQDYEMVEAALDFVLGLQSPDGDISWSAEAKGTSADDALLAGCSSIAKSLECGAALGAAVGADATRFIKARKRLVSALRHRPERFDRSGKNARFAMDWYYPALSGVLPREEASDRLRSGADRFVASGFGCRCVEDEPWVTAAETAELSLAWSAVDEPSEAKRFLDLACAMVDETGAFWMGWQMEERICWPQERPGWTQAAVILAADAIYEVSAAGRVLTMQCLSDV